MLLFEQFSKESKKNEVLREGFLSKFRILRQSPEVPENYSSGKEKGEEEERD